MDANITEPCVNIAVELDTETKNVTVHVDQEVKETAVEVSYGGGGTGYGEDGTNGKVEV